MTARELKEIVVIVVLACAFVAVLVMASKPLSAETSTQFKMTCTEVVETTSYNSGPTHRCENKEAVCYDSPHGLDCQFKAGS